MLQVTYLNRRSILQVRVMLANNCIYTCVMPTDVLAYQMVILHDMHPVLQVASFNRRHLL